MIPYQINNIQKVHSIIQVMYLLFMDRYRFIIINTHIKHNTQ